MLLQLPLATPQGPVLDAVVDGTDLGLSGPRGPFAGGEVLLRP